MIFRPSHIGQNILNPHSPLVKKIWKLLTPNSFPGQKEKFKQLADFTPPFLVADVMRWTAPNNEDNDYDDDDYYCDHDDDVPGKDTVCWWGPGHSWRLLGGDLAWLQQRGGPNWWVVVLAWAW